LPVQDFTREGQKVRFKLNVVGASYEGMLSMISSSSAEPGMR